MGEVRDILVAYEPRIKDDFQILTGSLEGVGINTFHDLVKITGIHKVKLAEDIFNISFKTISRYEKSKKRLSPRNSEMALKLLALYQKGIEVFGSRESFSKWLEKPALGLGNVIPFSVLSTATGIALIMEALARIEYGDLA